MKIQTNNATHNQIDWLVALCLGAMNNDPGLRDAETFKRRQAYPLHCYTKYPDQGLPILERERIDLLSGSGGGWTAEKWEYEVTDGGGTNTYIAFGPTMLIAGLRCVVVSRMGYEVEIPEDLK